MRAALICFYFFIGIQFCFSQGAVDGYMKSRGDTDFAFTYSYDHYNNYWFGDEKRPSENTIQSASFFAAHGFSDTLNIVVAIPYLWTDSLNRGFQDGIIMGKFRNLRKYYKESALSIITAAGLAFPLSNYPTNSDRPIGARSTVIQLRALAQYELYKGTFFMLKVGYDFRLTPIKQSAVPIMFKIGYGKPKIYADAWIELFQTFNALADNRIGGGSGSSWLRIGGTVYIPVKENFGVFVGGAKFISGKNIGEAARVNVGFVLKHHRK